MTDSYAAVGLGAGQAATICLAMLPSIQHVRNTDPTNSQASEIRSVELTAGLVSVGVGTVIAVASRSVTPLIVSGLVTAIVIGAYEYSLYMPPSTQNGVTQND